MSRLPPQFGPYEPIQRLGAGGMAETFVAIRRGPAGFEQRVCIKRILPAYENDQDFVSAFLQEARTSAQLRHANVVQVLDFGVADGSHYLALELIDGVDLRALLKRGGRGSRALDADVVTLIASDVALALEHAHGGGQGATPIVHRDVSPSNVLASRAGEIKLTDFGIARAIGGAHQTATGIIKGKVPYLPPEYIEHGRFDARSDLFSLGVMLHELLTGVRPFDGDSELDTVRRILAGQRPPIGDLVPDAPASLVAALDRLLAVSPKDRFVSARALLDALPDVAVHKARVRLGDLVRAELGEIDTGEAARVPATGAPPQPPARVQAARLGASGAPPASSEPTRTARRRLPVSRGAWLAASIAALALLSVAGFATLRLASSAGAIAPPPPPPRPVVLAAAQAAPSVPPPSQVSLPVAPPVKEPVPGPTPEPAAKPAPSAPAELRVVVIPFGEVWVDGKPRGHSPVTLKLSAGTHEVSWGDGRPVDKRTVQLRPGAHESLVFRRADSEL